MSDSNQYQTPSSRVDAPGQEYSEVNVLSAKGRMGRVRFINFYLLIPIAIMMGLSIIMSLVSVIMVSLLGSDPGSSGSAAGIVMMVVTLIISILYVVYSFMVIIQRCHDFNASGWLSLVMLIPGVGFIFLIALLVIPGSAGENNFGAQTKPNSTVAVVFASLSPIVLIFVVGVLAAIAIPAYQGYIDTANQAKQVEQQQLEQPR